MARNYGIGTCPDCDDIFNRRSSNHVRCSLCKSLHTREKRKQRDLKKREDILSQKQEWKRKNSTKVKTHNKAHYEKSKEKILSRQKKYYLENREKRQSYLREKLYDFDDSNYEEMFKEQNGVCKICGEPETRKRKGIVLSLHTDHNHVTGKVRGLLCAKCNLGLGHFNDDIRLIRKLLQYLEESE